jgi:hypothetical protein
MLVVANKPPADRLSAFRIEKKIITHPAATLCALFTRHCWLMLLLLLLLLPEQPALLLLPTLPAPTELAACDPSSVHIASSPLQTPDASSPG